MCIIEEIGKIKTREEYEGYYYKVSDVIKIMIMGLLCTMRTMSEIHGKRRRVYKVFERQRKRKVKNSAEVL